MIYKWRQKLHIEPPTGWLNDPNGLCFFDGRYHVFFQYSPDSATGNSPRGWGHYESSDLLSWNFKGESILPDTAYDCDGAYSGSAVVYDGRLHIFYTGNVNTPENHANVIHICCEHADDMGGKKVILSPEDYPDFVTSQVRDPKVWVEDGKWKMVLGAQTVNNGGCVLLYEGDSPDSFRFVKSLSHEGMGYMWECPDIFELDGNTYMTVSPQGIGHEEYRYQNTFSSGYFRIKGDGLSDYCELDCGFDFYAPQSFEAPDGRRILIGWMGMGDANYWNKTVESGYQHCLTLPRELTVAGDGALLQNPVRELKQLRGNAEVVGEDKWARLPFEVEAVRSGEGEIIMAIGGAKFESFDDGHCELSFTDEQTGASRSVRKAKTGRVDDVRMIVDTSGIEIYINGGRYVMSTRFYPEYRELKVTAQGATSVLYGLAFHDTLVSIGEALIDFIPNKTGCEFCEVDSFAPAVGGAPANVCAAFTRLGGKSRMITQLGNDPFGEVITGKLNEIGVDTSYVTYTDEANTALAFVSLKADGDRVFSFYRKPSADMLYEPYMLSPYMFDDCYALHFCSVSLGDFPMKKAHKAAITLASSHGAIISFDPNLRLMLWDSADKLTSAVLEFLPECDILKVSEEELEFITGSSDISTAIPTLFAGRVKLVICTCGGKGAYVVNAGGTAFSPAVPVEAVDTTGAGDGFIGAFLWRLKSNGIGRKDLSSVSSRILKDCADFANRFCSISVRRNGAIPSYPTYGEMQNPDGGKN